RIFFRDKRGNPDCRLEPLLPNASKHGLNMSAERVSRLKPVAHRGLVPVIDLDVLQPRHILSNKIQILEYVIGSDARTKTVPGTPTGHRLCRKNGRMRLGKMGRQLGEQGFARASLQKEEVLQLPCLPWLEDSPLCVHHGFNTIGREIELPSKAAAR